MKIKTQMLDLDKLADEVLAKSMKSEKDTSDNSVTPEDVSANIPDNDNEKPEETTSEEKEEREETVKKSVDTTDESSSEDSTEGTNEEEPEPEDKDEENEENEESIEKSFKSDETIKESIEASEFLESLVRLIVKSLGDAQVSLKKSQTDSQNAFEVFAKSLNANLRQGQNMQQQFEAGMQTLQKSITEQMDSMKSEVLEKLEEFSHQPASVRKSMKSVNIQDRNFQKSLGHTEGIEQLSKSQVLNTLTSELYSGNPLVQASDIISYESGAPLRPELESLVMSKH